MKNKAIILRDRFRSLHKGRFSVSVGMLVGGTAFGHGLMLLALPVVTRLYTPSDFSTLAVFASVLSILSVVACLRYEVAIAISENDDEAVNLLALALGCCTAISLLIVVAIWAFSRELRQMVDVAVPIFYIWLLPLGIWIGGAYSAFQFWSMRKQRFGTIARTKVGQAMGTVASQVGFGVLGLTPLGLILGQLCTTGAGIIGLGGRVLKEDKKYLKIIQWTEIHRVLRRYDNFPKYSTLEALANSAATQLPVILIASIALGEEAGYLLLAMRVIGAPMALIGASVGQVYLSTAPSKWREGNLGPFTMRISKGLLTSGGPIIFLGIVAPVAFPLIFGDQWRRAGEIVLLMTPWFMLQFVSSPVSMALHVTEHQRIALLLQVGGLILRCGSVLMAGLLLTNYVVEVYAGSGLVFYVIYLVAIFKILKTEFKEMFGFLLQLGKIAGIWGCVGLVVSFGLRYWRDNYFCVGRLMDCL